MSKRRRCRFCHRPFTVYTHYHHDQSLCPNCRVEAKLVYPRVPKNSRYDWINGESHNDN